MQVAAINRAFWREMFDTATSDVGTYSSSYLGPADSDTHSLKERFSPEQVFTHIAKTKGRRQFENTLGTCIARPGKDGPKMRCKNDAVISCRL
jgi:hypothetical protein